MPAADGGGGSLPGAAGGGGGAFGGAGYDTFMEGRRPETIFGEDVFWVRARPRASRLQRNPTRVSYKLKTTEENWCAIATWLTHCGVGRRAWQREDRVAEPRLRRVAGKHRGRRTGGGGGRCGYVCYEGGQSRE